MSGSSLGSTLGPIRATPLSDYGPDYPFFRQKLKIDVRCAKGDVEAFGVRCEAGHELKTYVDEALKRYGDPLRFVAFRRETPDMGYLSFPLWGGRDMEQDIDSCMGPANFVYKERETGRRTKGGRRKKKTTRVWVPVHLRHQSRYSKST